MALVHGETYLHCLCGRDDCPTAHLPRPERPKPEVHIHIDLESLLRLADRPGHVEGHGPIDPELARLLAGDATWQAVITDARRIQAERNGSVGDEGDEGETDSYNGGGTNGLGDGADGGVNGGEIACNNGTDDNGTH
ncbi:hypothetical protein FCG67_00080 [Rhodococcus oryzae]|uniref:HNH endonuclease n=1 Tax=Rhodococcus oryzae TaxID=2571143 RepID=A0ABY2RPU7_9NOCA|nr:hypothetical protein FCG67_00080 [Rhodococcus oryzae]